MDVQNKRKEVQRQQEQWMRERAAQSARLETQNIHNESKSTEQIIDRVTSHLMDKIKQEIKEEMKNDTEGQKYERFLAAEIESHTCAICYELMLAPSNSPILLHPCGHTFCKVCIQRHRQSYSKDKCPCCRENITAQAPNISLQQLIQNYVAKKQSNEKSSVTFQIDEDFSDENQPSVNLSENSDEKIHHVRREMQMKEMRARVMETELISIQDQKVKNNSQVNAAQTEFDQICQKLEILDKQIEELQRQRQQVMCFKGNLSDNLERLQKEKKELEERSLLISGVFDSLQEELALMKVVMDEHRAQIQ
eukprot:TRINITY_DN7512_c0_g2_i2.p1 TRINITY_DN7512_c0_g2~~TRINITY_DN7512_c0_g2_i2.p1  ORF type:complete len:308 (-),score=42.13 TRINITY_DN7512_c0_g2_i2:155-1078(-)